MILAFRLLAGVGMVAGLGCASIAAQAEISSTDNFEIRTLSGRADLTSGGDALVEIVTPKGTDARHVVVRLGAIDISTKFAKRSDGRIIGVVDKLVLGPNTLTAELDGKAQQLIITNYPIGGPVFSGPQLQPFRCDTDAIQFRLGPPVDVQCNAPTQYAFYYKHVQGGPMRPFDPSDPPQRSLIAKTTTEAGNTVPFIVRVETGTINRGIYQLAVLFDPREPWEPWAPQAAWNRKLEWRFGCGLGTGFRQGRQGGCYYQDRGIDELLTDGTVGKGYMVVTSTQANIGNNYNTAVIAETVMMTKEHVIKRYGTLRYTIGQGGSGGAITQHAVAQQYPGLLDGIRPIGSFPDPWSIQLVNRYECPLLNRYFDKTSPEMWKDVAQKDAVYGYEFGPPAGTNFCHDEGPPEQSASPWDPRAGGAYGELPPCVATDHLYDARTNPGGVRCGIPDYLVNILGRRPPSVWASPEKAIGHGFGNRPLDRVGVQYGLRALESGAITPAQFVDLNEKVGGIDIDGNWQPQRPEADPGVIKIMYRTGQIVDGSQMRTIPIIDYRDDRRGDVHSNRQSSFLPARMRKVNGSTANRAEWLIPRRDANMPVTPDVDANNTGIDEAFTLQIMEKWLDAIEGDHSSRLLAEKVSRDRPAEAADGCFAGGTKRIDVSACASYKLDSDPLLVAGMPDTRDILKCQLKPLRRGDYKVAFTDAQWARLQATFASGVCDWSKPGVGQQRSVPWLSFAMGSGGEPLPPPPKSTPAVSEK